MMVGFTRLYRVPSSTLLHLQVLLLYEHYGLHWILGQRDHLHEHSSSVRLKIKVKAAVLEVVFLRTM